MAVHPLWNQYPELKKELEETEKLLKKAVNSRNKKISEILKIFLSSGGKYLRPAYFLLFTKFGEPPSKKQTYYMAASLEILHTATLVHDDVIDDSPMRRNMPTIKNTYDNRMAVYSGDFLFTVYFELLALSLENVAALSQVSQTMKHILLGEMDQMNLLYNFDVTLKQYLRHIRGKTAQLFRLSCYQGSKIANCSIRTQNLSQRIGHNIGMAFQILDDILDYTSSPECLHKPILEDIQSGVYTLPLIFALEQNREVFFPLLEKKENMTKEDIQKVVELVTYYQGIEKAQSLAAYYTKKALQDIQKLPDRKEKKLLQEITSWLLNREN